MAGTTAENHFIKFTALVWGYMAVKRSFLWCHFAPYFLVQITGAF